MAELNISNITVPSVATMREHLLDSNPHPQYLTHSGLVSTVKSLIGIEDLRNVVVASGLPSKSLLVYDGIGRWVTASVDELIGEAAIPDATYSVKGGVRLTTPAGVNTTTDSSTVITPNTLDAWVSGKGLVLSSNLAQMIESAFSGGSETFPVGLQQLSNVVITNGNTSQVLMLESWDPVTGTGSFVNKSIDTAVANTSTFGVVRIATGDQIISGVGMTPEQMESSGYYVPSVSSVKVLTGGDIFVSRVNSATGSTSIYSAIVSSGSAGEGTTEAGYLTFVNKNGVVVKHTVSGGRFFVGDGCAVDVTAVTGYVYLGPVTSVAGTGYIPIYSSTEKYVKGVTYGLTLVSSASAYIGNGGIVSGLSTVGTSGSNMSNFHDNFFFMYDHAYAKDITLGRPMTEEEALTYSFHAQGHGYISSGARADNITVYARGDVNVGGGGTVKDVELDGIVAGLYLSSGAYAKNVYVRSGAHLVVENTAIAENVTVFSGGSAYIHSGAVVKGLTKLGGAAMFVSSGAVITYTNAKVEDLRIYSSGASYNITSDEVVTFSAMQHPTGIRKVFIDQSSHEVTHTFYPMAAATRVPNTVDPDYNNYTINAAGLEIWSDIHAGANNTQWYVTF